MNQLEQFREQCAKVLDEVGATLQTEDKSDAYWSGVGAMVDAGEIAIRAMPLPEVKQLQAPKEWANYDSTYVVSFIRERSHFDAPLIGEMLNFAIQSAKTPLPGVTQEPKSKHDICRMIESNLRDDVIQLHKENDQLRQRIVELESNKAVKDVIAERRRQIEVEGFTPERDDMYDCHELPKAAVCYAIYTLAYPPGDPVETWPWDKTWWKPSNDERRNRVKAAALLIAEIERLDRAALKGGAT